MSIDKEFADLVNGTSVAEAEATAEQSVSDVEKATSEATATQEADEAQDDIFQFSPDQVKSVDDLAERVAMEMASGRLTEKEAIAKVIKEGVRTGIEQPWKNRYSQKRQAEAEVVKRRLAEAEAEKERAKLQQEAAAELLRLYASGQSQLQPPPEEHSFMEKLQEKYPDTDVPSVLPIINDILEERLRPLQTQITTSAFKEQMDAARAAKAQEIASSDLKDVFPYEKAEPEMTAYYESHPEIHNIVIAMSPSQRVDYLYNIAAMNHFKSLTDEAVQKRLQATATGQAKSQEALKVAALSAATAASQMPGAQKETDDFIDRVANATGGAFSQGR